jgi:DNA-binding PadR family transcriptional regulator
MRVPMAKRRKVGNLLGLYLLSMLAQRPMYPYEMAQMLRFRGKDKNFPINWGSLYTVVANLAKHGFIEEAGTVREGRQPERTTYQITELGAAELTDWLTELLSVPEDESNGFVVALSEALILSPDEVIELLTTRLATLDKANAAQQAELKHWVEILPRVLLIESEYQLAMRAAQSQWLRGLLTELVEGTIGGIDSWRRMRETGEATPEFEALEEMEERAKRGWEQAPPAEEHDQET